jgi:Reverse transcriptase (RNA-dependent DNA polymerase)/Endonuclease/Exonuclease/phosphatase family
MGDSGARGGQSGETAQDARDRVNPSVRYMTRFQVRRQMQNRIRGGGASDTLHDQDNGEPGRRSKNEASASPRFARIATINMQAGHGAAAWNLRAVAKEAEYCKLDIVFVQETKINNDKHATRVGNYDIVATETSRNNRGGVAIFIRREEGSTESPWSCEDAKIYETNVIAATFVTGTTRRRLIGVYLSPNSIDATTWAGLQQACEEAVDPIWILGDLNADLHSRRPDRLDAMVETETSESTAEIKAFLATWGCENFGKSRLQRRRTGIWTWRLWRRTDGKATVVKSVCDYILGPRTDVIRRYRTKRTTYIRTDHRMVFVDFALDPKTHKLYLEGRKRFPFLRGPNTAVDLEYMELVKLQEGDQQKMRTTKPGWISETTWGLIKLRKKISDAPPSDPRTRTRAQLKRYIRRQLHKDRMKFFDDEAAAIEHATANQQPKEGFQLLQKWYKRRSGVRLAMSHQKLTTVANTWAELYKAKQLNAPLFNLEGTLAESFLVDDSELSVEEIRSAAKKLKAGKCPGVNSFRSDTMKKWANGDDGSEDHSRFLKLCALCQKIYRTGHVPQHMREGILVLLPKGNNDFRGITLLDCLYKLIASVLNRRAAKAIRFHEGVHGFRAERGCQTALREAKSDMQAREAAGKTYHQIFLDLSKAFDTVDRGRLTQIMRAYGFGFRSMRFFTNCWDASFVAPRAGGVFGPRVPVEAGVRQGDVISPLLFNLVVDSILRALQREQPELFARTQIIFYADDGRIGGETALDVQAMLDLIVDKFERVGLRTNTVKTVSMTNRLKFRSLNIAYGAKARVQMNAKEFEKRWNAYTECEICGKVLQNRSLKRHCQLVHPSEIASHVHPSLWSPGPVPAPEQDWTVFWDRDEATQQNLPMACPRETCLSFRFKSPSQLYKHWSIAGHDGRLYITDRRVPIHADATFKFQCPHCKMWMQNPVPQTHHLTKLCRDSTARRLAKVNKDINEKELMRSPFKSQNDRLQKVEDFLYLGRTLSSGNDDSLAVQRNIAKAKKKWAEIRRILSREVVKTKTFVRFYKAIVLNVLLYGSETWAITAATARSLEAFHNSCVRTISGQPIQRVAVGDEVHWVRPSIGPLLERTKLSPLSTYIDKRKNNLDAAYQTKSLAERCALPARPYIAKRALF